LVTAFGVVLWAVLIYDIATIRWSHAFLTFMVSFVGSWIVVVAVHELGHALAASARGFRVVTIFIGPLFVTRGTGDGVRLGVRFNTFGGAVLAAPKRWDGESRFRRDFFWFVVAGPLTSLVCGALGVWLAPRLTAVWVASIVSLVVGVLTLVPAQYASGRSSDGHKLWRLLRPPRPTETPLMALRLMANAMRPRDWDDALVAVASAESEGKRNPDAIDASLLLYFRALDREDPLGASALLQRVIDYMCGGARWPRGTIPREVAVEASYFEAAWRGDRSAAQAWLARAPFRMRGSATVLIAGALAGEGRATAKLWRQLQRTGYPASMFFHSATFDRLSSSSSS
jgi:hypothetical protein